MIWPIVALKSVSVVITKGTTPTTLGCSYSDLGIPFIRAENLQNGTIEFRVGTLFIDEMTNKLLARSMIKSGDVLISIAGTIGRVGVVPDDAPLMNCNQAVAIVRLTSSLLPRFLMHWLTSWEAKSQMTEAKVTQTISNLSLTQIGNLEIPIPPLSEQHRMVEILDEANRLRRLRREADAKAARILPALFLKMFGDPATNPMRWDITTIGNVVRAIDYGTSTRASDDGAGVPLIRMGNVDYKGHLDLRDLKHVQLSNSEVARFRLQEGDIIFNRTNSKELVGKTGLWDAEIDAVAASYFIRVRVDHKQIIPTFLWAFMNCSYMKKILLATARGAIGQANINSSELRAMVIYKPPLDQQHLFTNRWKQIRATIPQRIGDQTDLDNLFSTLLQHAFSGQLTAKWREARIKELLAEMEQQARLLNLSLPKELEAAP